MAIRPKKWQRVDVLGRGPGAVVFIRKIGKIVYYDVRLDSGDTVPVTGADMK